MAKYKKKRARELKHDRFRDTTMLLADKLADKVEGRGRQILYGLLVVIVIAAVGYGVKRWRDKHSGEAEAAMGRAITINGAEISAAPNPGSKDPVFTTQQERSQRAIEEFEKIAGKYGEPYRSEARYFIATNLLVTDRAKGESELQALSQGSGEIATLAKFALAQAKEADGNLDEAARLYGEIARQGSAIVTPDTANVRLASVYDKQGKKNDDDHHKHNAGCSLCSRQAAIGREVPYLHRQRLRTIARADCNCNCSRLADHLRCDGEQCRRNRPHRQRQD